MGISDWSSDVCSSDLCDDTGIFICHDATDPVRIGAKSLHRDLFGPARIGPRHRVLIDDTALCALGFCHVILSLSCLEDLSLFPLAYCCATQEIGRAHV